MDHAQRAGQLAQLVPARLAGNGDVLARRDPPDRLPHLLDRPDRAPRHPDGEAGGDAEEEQTDQQFFSPIAAIGCCASSASFRR